MDVVLPVVVMVLPVVAMVAIIKDENKRLLRIDLGRTKLGTNAADDPCRALSLVLQRHL